MEVILLEKVANLGSLGDKVRVRPGYGRNYLVPQGKAVPATEENVKAFEARRAELEKAAAEQLAAAQARAEKIAALGVITLRRKAGDEGKLFGSVTNVDIAEALAEGGAEVERREITMPEGPIRSIGEYSVTILLHTDVSQALTVVVEAE